MTDILEEGRPAFVGVLGVQIPVPVRDSTVALSGTGGSHG